MSSYINLLTYYYVNWKIRIKQPSFVNLCFVIIKTKMYVTKCSSCYIKKIQIIFSHVIHRFSFFRCILPLHQLLLPVRHLHTLTTYYEWYSHIEGFSYLIVQKLLLFGFVPPYSCIGILLIVLHLKDNPLILPNLAHYLRDDLRNPNVLIHKYIRLYIYLVAPYYIHNLSVMFYGWVVYAFNSLLSYIDFESFFVWYTRNRLKRSKFFFA